MARHLGNVKGVGVGDAFAHRGALIEARVPLPTQAGIPGRKHEGSDFIAWSGVYEDDQDNGACSQLPEHLKLIGIKRELRLQEAQTVASEFLPHHREHFPMK